MAGQRLTVTDDLGLDEAAAAVIDAYLAELGHRLPGNLSLEPGVQAELRADLAEATLALVPASPSSVAAARAATAQFGDVDDLAAAFRRAGRAPGPPDRSGPARHRAARSGHSGWPRCS